VTSDLSTPAWESLKRSRWPVEGSGGVGWGGVGGGLIWEFECASKYQKGLTMQFRSKFRRFLSSKFDCQLQWGAEYAPNGDTEG